MDNAKFFECGVSVLDMVYDALTGNKVPQTLYRTSINGAPTAILVSELLDSTVAVGKRNNLSFMATLVEGKTRIYYNHECDLITKDFDSKTVSAFLSHSGTVKMVSDTSKDSFIDQLVGTVLA
uniref:Uncharacterized protein n=1 Tax=Pantoea phage Survivor TaxID=3232176 RepID=A0AAU8KXJ9_9CAUD